jgi:hypothetical protein
VLKPAARALFACGLLGLCGCYVYVPAELQTVLPGENVRMRVSRGAIAEFAEVLPGGEPVVRGTLVRREQDRLFVRVPITTRREGFMNQPITQDVGIAAGEILELELRRKSGGRTALFVAGTGVVAAAVIGTIVAGDRDRVIRDDGPPDEMRIPLGR